MTVYILLTLLIILKVTLKCIHKLLYLYIITEHIIEKKLFISVKSRNLDMI